MSEFWRELDRELVRVGIWGRAADRLREELHDHCLMDHAALLGQGRPEAEAGRIALARLGDPAYLAANARAELARRDGGWKSQLLLLLAPLASGPVTFAACLGFWRGVFYALHAIYGWRLDPTLSSMTAVILFVDAAMLCVLVGPWLVVFLWVLRANRHPWHGPRYLNFFAIAAAASNFNTAAYLDMTDPSINMGSRLLLPLLGALSLVIAVTPWRVRLHHLRLSATG